MHYLSAVTFLTSMNYQSLLRTVIPDNYTFHVDLLFYPTLGGGGGHKVISQHVITETYLISQHVITETYLI